MIRTMTVADVERVYEIAAVSFSDGWSKALYTASVENEYEYGIVYECDGEVAGFAILTCSIDTADIADVVVAPEYRRRGIADALIKELFSYGESKGISEYALEVRKSNEAAISLYEKNGFVTEFTRKNYYINPREDARIMWKRKY